MGNKEFKQKDEASSMEEKNNSVGERNYNQLDQQDYGQYAENIEAFSEESIQKDKIAFEEFEIIRDIPKKKNKIKIAFNIAFGVVIAFLVVFVIFVNTFQLCLVMGSSMTNTLQDSEFLLMQKRGFEIERGDIVTIYVEKKDDYPIIKRVIALKGDRLVFMYGENRSVELYLDKGKGFEKLSEPYIRDGKMSSNIFLQLQQFMDGTFKIAPRGSIENISDYYVIDVDGLFVLGDNRDDSLDSRHYGILSYKNVEGKMVAELKKGSFAEKFLKKLFNAD